MAAEKKESTKVYIGNLPGGFTGDNLKELFETYGAVTESDVIYNSSDKQVGFVHFKTPEEAKASVEALNGTSVQDQTIKVEISNKPSRIGGGKMTRGGRGNRPFRGGPRGGFRGGFGGGDFGPPPFHGGGPFMDPYMDPYMDPFMPHPMGPPGRFHPYGPPRTGGPMRGHGPGMGAAAIARIGTTDGRVNPADVVGCYLLTMLPEMKNAEVVRKRGMGVLKTCDALVGIGSVYEHSRKRYDAKAKGFVATMNALDVKLKWMTKLSSAGLVFFHVGKRIVAGLLESPQTAEIVQTVFEKMYECFIEEIDAQENDVVQCEGKPRYTIHTGLYQRIEFLNPFWNEDLQNTDDRFHRAMAMVGREFVDRVKYYGFSWYPAHTLMTKAMSTRKEIDPSGQIVLLGDTQFDWQYHLHEQEREEGCKGQLKFVLFQDAKKHWRLQAVPIKPTSHKCRHPLPKEWCGKKNEELSEITGLAGCVFVHDLGFIGAHNTYEGTLLMAQKALELGPGPGGAYADNAGEENGENGEAVMDTNETPAAKAETKRQTMGARQMLGESDFSEDMPVDSWV